MQSSIPGQHQPCPQQAGAEGDKGLLLSKGKAVWRFSTSDQPKQEAEFSRGWIYENGGTGGMRGLNG